jgi:hypothetical protein
MANQLMAKLNASEDGSIHNIMRSLSVVCCLGSVAASAVALRLYDDVYTDGDGQAISVSLMVPGSAIAVWTSIYLILNYYRVTIPLPVTLTFDLLSWLYALVNGLTGAAVAPINSPIRCDEYGCAEWMRIKAAVVVCSTLLLIVA